MNSDNTKSKDSSKDISGQSVVTVTKFICPTCQEQVIAKPPAFRVSNFPEFSNLTCIHHPVKCECGSIFVPMMIGVSSNLELVMRWERLKIQDTPIKTSKEEKERRDIQEAHGSSLKQ